MTITKLGHSCLIIETKGKRILIDPGSFSKDNTAQEKNIDYILVTHAHGDHLDVPSMKELLRNNPNAKIITNTEISGMLDKEGIPSEILENEEKNYGGVSIRAIPAKHEEIFEDFGQVQNTAYFVDKRLLVPGDSLEAKNVEAEILALPVGGPWNKVKDFMDYAIALGPKICFPYHDGMFGIFTGSAYGAPKALLPKYGIEFKVLENNKAEEF